MIYYATELTKLNIDYRVSERSVSFPGMHLAAGRQYWFYLRLANRNYTENHQELWLTCLGVDRCCSGSTRYARLLRCFVLNIELLHFLPQVFPTDAECGSCFGDMSVVGAQAVLDIFSFAGMKIFVQ